MPEPSDPKDGDGDVFDYAKDHMTDKGHLLNHKGEKAVSSLSSQLAGIWNMGFGDPTRWGEEYGGGSSSGGGGGGGGGTELTPEELEERCKALNGDGSTGDSERNALNAASIKGIDDSGPSRNQSVTVLAVILLIVFFGLLFVEKMFQWLYGRLMKHGSYTLLRLKVVLDSATREITVLAFVLLVGYMFLWSGIIASFEENVLGYDEEDEHLLTALYGDVHFLLTAAMLLFMLITLILVILAERSTRDWSHYELHVTEAPHAVVADYCEAHKMGKQKGSAEEAQMDFLTLRMRFSPLLYRDTPGMSSIPRIRNADETTSRFAHFDFAEYLSYRLGKEMSRVLSVGLRSWILVEIFMLLLTLPLLASWQVQFFIFGLFGFIPLFIHYVVRRKLRKIWMTIVTQSKAQKAVRDANEKITESKFWAKDNKTAKNKSAEFLNAMMHNSVQSESDMEKLFWSPSMILGGGNKSNGRALLLQQLIRLVIVLSAISSILIPMAAGIGFANEANVAGFVILVFGYLPILIVLFQIRGVMEQYVILTSIGPFRKPKVVQTIVDDKKHRFSVGVAYFLDWIVLGSTVHLLSTDETLVHCALDKTVKFDKELMNSFFNSVTSMSKSDSCNKSDFSRWYRRYKVLCNDSWDANIAIKTLFNRASSKGKIMTRAQFVDAIKKRDQIEMEILYNRGDGDWTKGQAINHISSLVYGKNASKDSMTLKDFRERMKKLLGADKIRPSEKLLEPLFKEAAVIGNFDPENTPVPFKNLAGLILKYSPTSRNLASGMSS